MVERVRLSRPQTRKPSGKTIKCEYCKHYYLVPCGTGGFKHEKCANWQHLQSKKKK